MANGDPDYQAKVEDYYSDDDDHHHSGGGVEANLPPRQSPSAANSKTKRSNEANSDQPPAQETMPANIDLRSDSGYSSYTAASKSSADSAPSMTSRIPPILHAPAPPVPSQSPAPKPRRPTNGEQPSSRHHSNESSPRQRPARTASVSTKQRPPMGSRRNTVTQECRDPNCKDCGLNLPPPPPPSSSRRRPDMQPSMPARNIPGYPSDQVLQRSDPNPYYSPPSPIYTRQPAPYSQGPTYSQGAAIIQTNRARRSSSITQRPQTIAGEPSAGFWVPGMAPGYPSPPQERGPPPSNSAYQSMQNMQYPGYAPPYGSSGMPQSGYYPPANQTSPPYEMGQRPPLSARGSGYGRSNYPAPIITQDSNKYPSARYGQPPTPNEHQLRAPNQPRLLQYGNEEEDEDSTSESSDEDPEYGERMAHEARQREAREARALMPPPKMKTKRDQSLRRPPLPHANTTQVVDRMENNRRRQSIVVPDRSLPRESREPREQRRERDRDPIVSRRASISRPPPPQQTQSAYDTRGGRMVVNNSMRASRRQSYQAYEQRAYQEKAYFDNWNSARAEEEQLKAEQLRAEQLRAEQQRIERLRVERLRAEKQEKRASRVLVEQDRRMLAEQMRRMPGQFDDEEEEDEQPVRALSRPRRKTDADARKGKERIPESKPKRAENAAEEYINKTRGARDPHADMINKAAKAPRYPSLPSDDSGSSRSHGSGKASQSNQTTMTSNTNNEIRIRVDEGSRLQLTGDMDGRTLQLVPTENGMTELVIGNSRGNEIAYHQSERGSVMGSNNRRSIIAGQVRRDAEDVSERSSRSGRSRRDRDEIREARDDRDVRGHVLRRSRTTNYH